MNCPSCGAEVVDGAILCSKCGLGLQPATPTFGSVEPEPPRIRSAALSRVLAVVAGLFLALILFAIGAREYVRTGNAAYAVGASLGTVLLPTVGVLLYYRNKKAQLARVLFVLSAWCFFALFVTSGPFRKGFTKEDVPQLAREAVGKETVTDFDEERELVRSFFRKAKAENDVYMLEVNALDPKLSELALAQESWKDAATMDMVEAHFKKVLDIEDRHEERTRGLLAEFTKEMDKLNWSDSKKEAFRTGAAKGFGEQMKKRSIVYDAEIAYLNEAIGLYRYGRQNAKYFVHHPDGTVALSDPNVLAEFNRRVASVNEKMAEFNKRQETFTQEQAKALGEMGLTMEDMGVKQPK